MLNEVPGMDRREPRAEPGPRRRFRPHPVSVFPWLFALVLLWYAAPRGGFFPKPGTLITSHYPLVLQYGKTLLAAYWICAAIALGVAAVRRRPRGLMRTLEVLIAVLVVAFGAAYAMVRWGDAATQNAAGTVGLLTGAAAFLIAAALTSPRQPRSALVPLALSLIAVMPLTWPEMPALWPYWQDMTQLKAPDGRVYHIQRKEMLQARDYVLTVEVKRGTLLVHTRVLGDGLELSYEGPVLVRPVKSGAAPPPLHHRELVASYDGAWVVSVSEPWSHKGVYRVCLAYYLRTQAFYRGPDWSDVSPFLLIGPADALDRGDVKALRSWLYGPGPPHEFPSIDALRRDARHPNPRVRALVAELLGGWRDQAAVVALRQLASDPDPAVRSAATEALKGLKHEDKE